MRLHRVSGLFVALTAMGCVSRIEGEGAVLTDASVDEGDYSAIVTPHDIPRLIVKREADHCSFIHFLGMSERESDGGLPGDWDAEAACLVTACDDTGLWESCTPVAGIVGWMRVIDGDLPTQVSLDLTVSAGDDVRFVADDLLVAPASSFD